MSSSSPPWLEVAQGGFGGTQTEILHLRARHQSHSHCRLCSPCTHLPEVVLLTQLAARREGNGAEATGPTHSLNLGGEMAGRLEEPGGGEEACGKVGGK